MNVLDIFILGVLLISAVIGIVRGFTKETLTLLTWFLAAYLAYRFSADVGNVFSGIETAYIRNLIGGIIVVVSVLIIGGICSGLFGKLVSASGLFLFDRTLGGGLGLLRGGLVILLLIPFCSDLNKQEWWQASKLIPHFSSASEKIIDILPDEWKQNLGQWDEHRLAFTHSTTK